MNLGDVCIKAAVAICLGASLLALLTALILRHLRRIRWMNALVLVFVLATVLSCGGLYFGHRPLFVAWHRAQNEFLPRTGCLTYEPSFFRLYASYRMSREEFDDWVKRHPWKLMPYDEPQIADRDAEQLGFERPDEAFASEPAPNGRQLRVYFGKDTMFVSYFVM